MVSPRNPRLANVPMQFGEPNLTRGLKDFAGLARYQLDDAIDCYAESNAEPVSRCAHSGSQAEEGNNPQRDPKQDRRNQSGNIFGVGQTQGRVSETIY